MLSRTCNGSSLGGWGGRITWSQEFGTSLSNIVRCLLNKKFENQLGMVVHTCNPNCSGGWGWRITWAQEFEATVSYDCTTAWPTWQNPSLLKIQKFFGRPRRANHKVRSSRPAWPTWWNPISTKNTKISRAWWRLPVILATWEAEAGELLEPGGGGCNELRWRHCTPAWWQSETLSQK